MYELRHAGGNSYYIESPSRVGLVKLGGNQVCMIDSSNSTNAGRRIKRILDENHFELSAIYITHANGDHSGGSHYLQEETGCRVFAPGVNCPICRYPILELAFFYGGYPSRKLRRRFHAVQECRAEFLTGDVLPEGMERIPLPGHFFEMDGFRTADDVVFLADALCSRETLEGYPLSFVYDVAAYLDTLERVKNMRAKLFVPAHIAPMEEIAPLAEYNIQVVRDIIACILELCREPILWEGLLQKLIGHYGMEKKMNYERYVLVGNTVRSYLSYLQDEGRMENIFDRGALLWKSL